jgi:hypothetical protein
VASSREAARVVRSFFRIASNADKLFDSSRLRLVCCWPHFEAEQP